MKIIPLKEWKKDLEAKSKTINSKIDFVNLSDIEVRLILKETVAKLNLTNEKLVESYNYQINAYEQINALLENQRKLSSTKDHLMETTTTLTKLLGSHQKHIEFLLDKISENH